MLLMNATRADWRTFAALPREDLRAHFRFMQEIDAQLRATGELIRDDGLSPPEHARLVRAGTPAFVGASFPEDKEFLAGYWIVDCDSPERAVEIAARVSSAPGRGGAPMNFPVEVRQVMRAPGEEM
jgi:hypothetical protein